MNQVIQEKEIIDNAIRETYPDNGPDLVAQQFGIKRKTVIRRANKLGVFRTTGARVRVSFDSPVLVIDKAGFNWTYQTIYDASYAYGYTKKKIMDAIETGKPIGGNFFDLALNPKENLNYLGIC